MSKYVLDVECPFPDCESKDIQVDYDGETDEIVCVCNKCKIAGKLSSFYYTIEPE